MRLNEKHLAAYATSNTAIDKQGILHKKGEVNKAFQKRWFVLKGNLLFYFEKKGDKEPLGVVILEGCTVELAEIADTNAFCILFRAGSGAGISGGRTYTLAADTQDEMEAWMRACASANYEYLRLTVAELQRQLDELNSSPVSSTSSTSSLQTTRASSAPRFNPFDGSGRQARDTAAESVTTVRSFHEMHLEFGAKIKSILKS